MYYLLSGFIFGISDTLILVFIRIEKRSEFYCLSNYLETRYFNYLFYGPVKEKEVDRWIRVYKVRRESNDQQKEREIKIIVV